MMAFVRYLLWSVVVLMSTMYPAGTDGAVVSSTYGKQFVFGFIGTENHHARVVISTMEKLPVNVDVSIPGIEYNRKLKVTWPNRAVVDIEEEGYPNIILTQSGNQEYTVIVTASADVSVYAFTLQADQTVADSFVVLPTSSLGTKYYALAWKGLASNSQIAVFALGDGETTVSFSNFPSVKIDPFSVTLAPYESYLYQKYRFDLTATLVTADKPVAVVTGTQCVHIPQKGREGYDDCKLIVEQVPDTSSFGKHFILTSFPGRSGFYYKGMAAEDATEVNTTSPYGVKTEVLAAGGKFGGASYKKPLEVFTVESSKPIIVAQYLKNVYSDNQGDPFMIVVPPVEQYSTDVSIPIFYEPSEHTVGLKLTSRCCDQEGLYVNGEPLVNLNSLAVLPGKEYCTTVVEVATGSTCDVSQHNGGRFSALLYAFGPTVGYGYPVQYDLKVQLEPPVMSQAPILVSASRDGITVEWQSWGVDPSDSGDGPITEYLVFYQTGDHNWVQAGSVYNDLTYPEQCSVNLAISDDYVYTVEGLSPSYYEFSIAAVGLETGEGPLSPPAVAAITTTMLPTTTLPPTTTSLPTTTFMPTTRVPTTAKPVVNKVNNEPPKKLCRRKRSTTGDKDGNEQYKRNKRSNKLQGTDTRREL